MKRIALALVLCLTASARASEPNIVGIGVRSPALAGTGAADSTGYEASYTNPAGLAMDARRSLSVGYIIGRWDLTLDKTHQNLEHADAILLGANLPLPFGGILKDRLSVGLAFYLPKDVITEARAPFPTDSRLAMLATQTQTVSVLAALGAKVHQRVYVGLGVLALAALRGQIFVKADAAGHLATQAEQQLVTGFAPTAGVRVVAAPWALVGVSLVGESTATYDLTVNTNLKGQLPVDLPALRFHGAAQFDPLRLNMEASFVVRFLRVNVGVTYKNWANWKRPIENATAGAPPLPKTGFKDTAVPRLACELTWLNRYIRLDGRIGYFFEPTPAPHAASNPYVDADRHVLTLGLGARMQRWVGLQVDVFGQLQSLAGSARAGGRFGFFGAQLGVDL